MEPLQSKLALALLDDDVPLLELDITVFTTLNVSTSIALARDPLLHLVPSLIHQALELMHDLSKADDLVRVDDA